jgi:pSer/pThr/pTyr-binding forkhead associated (FHA) protein
MAHSIDLRPASGDVLGRRFGPHAEVLGRFSQISSNHLEVRQDADGDWHVKDLNSFNHSFYNGKKLVPQQEQRLEPGATLSLGDIAFGVSFE